MKTLTHCIGVLLLCICVPAFSAQAQMIQDPTDWKFSIKKQDATHYTLLATTSIKPKWHIYAMNPGGEGELIGTSFEFAPGGAKVAGSVKEVTPAHQETMLDERVNLHSEKATFCVSIAGKKGQTISGSVEYQACNDMMCLPPKKKSFSLKLP